MQLIDTEAATRIYADMPPGGRDLRRLGGQHRGRRRRLRRPRPPSSARSPTTSSATCSATTSAPPACEFRLGAGHRRRRRPGHRPLPDPRHPRRPAHHEHLPRRGGPARARRRRGRARSPGSRSSTARATSGTSPSPRRPCARPWTPPTTLGTPVSFTLSDAFCVDRHRAEFLDLVEHRVDILFANEDEICSLYEVDDFEEAARRVQGHCAIACLTRSEKGSVILTAEGERIDVPAAPDRGRRHHRRRRPLRRRVPRRLGPGRGPRRPPAAWPPWPRPR